MALEAAALVEDITVPEPLNSQLQEAALVRIVMMAEAQPDLRQLHQQRGLMVQLAQTEHAAEAAVEEAALIQPQAQLAETEGTPVVVEVVVVLIKEEAL